MRKIVLGLSLLLLTLAPVQASNFDDLSKLQRSEVLRYAVSNSLFTLYHEMGHLLIDRLNLPVLGREEDAADNIATWVMLDKKTPEMNRALQDAAAGWMTTARKYQAAFNTDDYTAGYSPDRHRALQIVCLMVGADGAAFRKFANGYSLSPERQRDCAYRYEGLHTSIASLFSKQIGPSRVDITYLPGGRSLRLEERILRSSGIMEKVADELRDNFKVPGRVQMTARRCEEPNAFYDTTSTEIIFCYELIKEFVETYSVEVTSVINRR